MTCLSTPLPGQGVSICKLSNKLRIKMSTPSRSASYHRQEVVVDGDEQQHQPVDQGV